VLYGDTGWVDPYSFTNALKAAAEADGARFETGVTVTDVLEADGRVTGVETDDGVRRADDVVLAAGWRTGDLLGDDVQLPVRPYRTQVVVLEPDTDLPDDFPLIRVGSEELYMRPEHNGDLLVGGSHHTLDDPPGASGQADEEFQMQVASVLPEFVDGFERAGVVNDWAGVDTGTPDGRPVIDAPEGTPEGLVVAAGFNGLGVTVSPAAGAAVRGLVTGEDPGFDDSAFRLDRLAGEDGNVDIHYTSDI
jgi:sarcosine oxidase subunit beta